VRHFDTATTAATPANTMKMKMTGRRGLERVGLGFGSVTVALLHGSPLKQGDSSCRIADCPVERKSGIPAQRQDSPMAIRTLQLSTNCPQDHDAREACGKCLRAAMLKTAGVRSVVLRCDGSGAAEREGAGEGGGGGGGGGAGESGGGQVATLELEYDPRLIPLAELDAEIRRAGMTCGQYRGQVVLGVEGMASPRSEQMIEAALARLPGVVASASYASKSLRVEFDRRQCALPEIVRRLDSLGLRLRQGGPAKQGGQGRAKGGTKAGAQGRAPAPSRKSIERVRELIIVNHKLAMALIGGLLLIAAVITRAVDGPIALRLICVIAGFIIAGWYTAIDTFHVLREFRFDVDVLMFAAAFGAAALGRFEEGALLLVLFALGGAGEELAIDRARKAIDALAKLAPDTATVRDPDGRERLVQVEALEVGQRVVVRPFDRVPADGVVESGESAIDQSPITGESVPVEKSAGARVFAGTINGEGLLLIGVSRLAGETTLAKIVRLVQEAQTTKSPTQVFTDKVEKWYVPAVLAGTAALIFIPPIALAAAWGSWFYRAMTFLTAASPCALAIGTPAAVLSGIARAAQIGVLVKGGVHLENLARVRAVAFDKTGTLTAGRPRVTRILALDPAFDEEQVLALAAAVDAHSAHPAATAIVDEARSRGIAPVEVEIVTTLAGRGASARLEGHDLYVGKLSAELIADARVAALAGDGQMLAQVRRDDRAIGIIALADAPRANAAATIASLHRLGVAPCVMLTGDRSAVAGPIARQLGIDVVRAELMPEDKLRLIGQMQEEYGAMAMVGDGVNDAPALATAAVGIAMGGAGTDVAIETADVALMADDLGKLPDAIALARLSRRIIHQNLIIALGVISVLAPLAALGYTYLGIAVLFHEGSTVVVVLNAMRLLLYRPAGA
jgi:Cd2+/Zn2+-exporting ATPase